MNPYAPTKLFEAALCDYTGAPFAVAVNSCTAALLLCVAWHTRNRHRFATRLKVEIPRRTYVSVPNAITLAGARVRWRDERWTGAYQLKPLPVWDCARRFTSGMHQPGQFQCVSFASNKILGIEQGGAILHDDPQADEWFRLMRFDGRTEGVDPMADTFTMVGHHCIMLPSIAAQGLLRLFHLPRHNPDMVEGNYPDLSRFGAWA